MTKNLAENDLAENDQAENDQAEEDLADNNETGFGNRNELYKKMSTTPKVLFNVRFVWANVLGS